jgi:hypothetical protein
MPEKPNIPEIEEIKPRDQGNAGMAVNRVGKLYEAIIDLFHKLDDADFQSGSIAYQADFDTWGRDYARAPRGTSASPKKDTAELIVRPVFSRTTALAALQAVAEQGEGNQDNDSEFSHFQRFVAIFRDFKSDSPQFVRNVARNPITMGVTAEPDDEPFAPIRNQKSLLWAQLFNTRYRLLLSLLAHALHAEGLTSSGRPVLVAIGRRSIRMYQLRALRNHHPPTSR